MAFVVTGITDYVEANQLQLIGKAVLGAKSIANMTPQVGVKGSAYVNLANMTATLQAGGCGWTAAGSTTLSRRKIETGLIKLNEAFCDKDLVTTQLSYGVQLKAGAKTLPFEQSFVEGKVKSIAAKNDALVWGGDTAAASGVTYNGLSNAEVKLTDGLIKIIAAASATTVDASPASGKSLTVSADVVAIVDGIVAKIPNEIIASEDLRVFMGQDAFRTYQTALIKANLYHYNPELDGNFELAYPGSSIKIIGVSGLNGAGKAYASTISNLFVGIDMLGDAEQFEMFYDQSNREYRLVVEYNLGLQIGFPEFVVSCVCS